MFINQNVSQIIEKKKNNNCIFFAISNDYSFAVANVIMSLYSNSKNVIQNSDVIIFFDELNDSNKRLLKNIHKDTIFVPISFSEKFNNILNHPTTLKWGI